MDLLVLLYEGGLLIRGDVTYIVGYYQLSFYLVRAAKCLVEEAGEINVGRFGTTFCYVATDGDNSPPQLIT